MASRLVPLIDSLCEKLASTTIEEVGLELALEKDLLRLRGLLIRIRMVLPDSDECQDKDDAVSLWLSEVKELIYHLEDILDEMETQTKDDARTGGSRRKGKLRRSLSSLSLGFPFGDTDRVKRGMASVCCGLDELVEDAYALHLGKSLPEMQLARLQTSSFTHKETTSILADDVSIVGRDEDKESIVRFISEEQKQGGAPFSVLSIVGMGGIGKTTLAQLVFNDPRIQIHFEVRAWVYMGSKSESDLLRLCEEVFEAAKGKRFMIVLDDVWAEEPHLWEVALRPLMSAERGSSILVTTRIFAVAHCIGIIGVASSIHFLKLLSSEDCWFLFNRIAFRDGNSSMYPHLEAIGRALVRRMRGLPLAAKSLGALLRSEREESLWRRVLESELWEVGADTGLLPVLKLSYNHLPAAMKQCFAFCSIFPQDFVFDKSELVQMWIAHGFIRPHGVQSMEDTGSDYLGELLQRSFFFPDKDCYKMHDLIHDLACFVSHRETCLVEDKIDLPIRDHVFHVSFFSNDLRAAVFFYLQKIRHLRTLQLRHRLNCDDHHIPTDLLINLKCLRVLVLHCEGIKKLPEGICELKHLRYLDVSFTRITELPQTLTMIHNLQTLKVEHCPLQVLPRGMSNLINLRHLKADPNLVAGIYGIGKLTALQELEEFTVQNEDGYRIRELKDMKELHGSLSILNLENVQDKREAEEANLRSKIFVRRLGLEWSHITRVDIGVLEGLQPNVNLRMLHIKNYDGGLFPVWIDQQILLQDICLENCRISERLPSLGQLPMLKSLTMKGMKGLKYIGNEFSGNRGFPVLEKMQLHDMLECQGWSGSGEDKLFPDLHKLVLVNCPNLMAFPQLPPVLTELKVEMVGLTALPDIQGSHISLCSLDISGCPKFVSLFSSGLSYHLTSLRTLSIVACKELMSLPEGWFRDLVSLENLKLEDCPELTSPQKDGSYLPSSLKSIQVGRCPHIVNKSFLTKLQSLPSVSSSVINKSYGDLDSCAEEALGCLTALQALKIQWCDVHKYVAGGSLARVSFRYVIDNDSFHLKECFPSSKLKLQICPLYHVNVKIGALTQHFQALTSLEICGCPNLVSLLARDLFHLHKLEKLAVTDCKELNSLGLPLLPYLQYMKIQDCSKLTSITWEGYLQSLQILQLIGLNKLHPLPPELLKVARFD